MKAILFLFLCFSIVACNVTNAYCGENSESVVFIKSLTPKEKEFLFNTMKNLAQKNPYGRYGSEKSPIPKALKKYKFTNIKMFSKNSAIGYLEFCSLDYRAFLSFDFPKEDKIKGAISLNWGGDLEQESLEIYHNPSRM
jgi:hypothetical protein